MWKFVGNLIVAMLAGLLFAWVAWVLTRDRDVAIWTFGLVSIGVGVLFAIVQGGSK